VVHFNDAQSATLLKFLRKWSEGREWGATPQGAAIYLSFTSMSVYLKEDGTFEIVED